MEFQYSLRNFSKPFKRFIAAFVLVLGIGYFTGLLFVNQTESTSPSGVVENYNGNEDVAEVKVMKFKKGEREMLTIIHISKNDNLYSLNRPVSFVLALILVLV